jgi:hypothetical protein
MYTEFKIGKRVIKVAKDYTNGRVGLVLAVDVTNGKSLIFWYRQYIRKWVSWNSLKLADKRTNNIVIPYSF